MINPCLTYSMIYFIERDFRFLSGEGNWNDGTEQMHRDQLPQESEKVSWRASLQWNGREGCKIGHMEEKLTGLGGLLVHVCACACAHTHACLEREHVSNPDSGFSSGHMMLPCCHEGGLEENQGLWGRGCWES